MRIVVISDTHEKFPFLGNLKGDILIHCGDFTNRGTMASISKFNDWLGKIKENFKEILVVAGNHDLGLEKFPEHAEGLLTNARYLRDASFEIDGIKFYGSPWQPEFYNWAFNLPRNGEELKAAWANIPNDTNILITHGPPFGVLDRVRPEWNQSFGESVGCELLRERVFQLDNLVLNVFGHIHEGYGTHQEKGIIFGNASFCDYKYRSSNKPLIFEVHNGKCSVVSD